MGIQYIEPFVEAAVHVFTDFFGETPHPQKPFLLRREDETGWELSGIIGIGGDSKGVVVVSLTESVAITLTGHLVGHPITEVNDDVMDTIGELVNIIAGNAKKGLEQYRLVISLPSIVRGRSHQVSWPFGIPVIGIPFIMPSGSFFLAVGLENIIREVD